MTCDKCDKCGKCESPCGCGRPFLDIGLKSGSSTELSYNINGLTSTWDYYGIVQAGQTDTTLGVNTTDRTMVYNAERHTNTISSKELGSILHIADIGDVDISGVQDNSMFVYQKNSDCGEGCDGLDNSWIAHNALEHIVPSARYIMAFDENGKPKTLGEPANGDRQYLLGWDRGNQVSYFTPREVATPPQDADGYEYRLYLDPSTGEIVVYKASA